MSDKLIKAIAITAIGGCIVKTIQTVKLRKLEKEIAEQIEEQTEEA